MNQLQLPQHKYNTNEQGENVFKYSTNKSDINYRQTAGLQTDFHSSLKTFNGQNSNQVSVPEYKNQWHLLIFHAKYIFQGANEMPFVQTRINCHPDYGNPTAQTNYQVIIDLLI